MIKCNGVTRHNVSCKNRTKNNYCKVHLRITNKPIKYINEIPRIAEIYSIEDCMAIKIKNDNPYFIIYLPETPQPFMGCISCIKHDCLFECNINANEIHVNSNSKLDCSYNEEIIFLIDIISKFK